MVPAELKAFWLYEIGELTAFSALQPLPVSSTADAYPEALRECVPLLPAVSAPLVLALPLMWAVARRMQLSSQIREPDSRTRGFGTGRGWRQTLRTALGWLLPGRRAADPTSL